MKSPCMGCVESRTGCKVRTLCREFKAYEEYMHKQVYPARARHAGNEFNYFDHIRSLFHAPAYRHQAAAGRAR